MFLRTKRSELKSQFCTPVSTPFISYSFCFITACAVCLFTKRVFPNCSVDPCCIWIAFLWYVFAHSFSIFLSHLCVSYRQCIFCFVIQSVFFFLIVEFSQFAFIEKTDLVLVLSSYLIHCFYCFFCCFYFTT